MVRLRVVPAFSARARVMRSGGLRVGEAAEEGEAAAGLPESIVLACIDGDTAAVAAWLDAGGEGRVDTTWDGPRDVVRGVTLLMMASKYGHEATVKVLLERGASVDHQDSFDLTALMYAACNGYASIVMRLLQTGAQWEMRGNNGRSALQIAQGQGHHECVRAIEEHEAAAAASARAA